MADSKISELTAITGANTADDDLLVIVDTSASQTKKITLGELENALAERDFNFGDNDKAIFGAGSDLQIYHDGFNSYIDDTGTGVLNIRAETYIALSDMSNKVYLTGTSGGAVGLRYNDAQKLATTSTGIDVTGTVTADGLTVDGNTVRQNGTLPFYLFMETDTTDLNTQLIQTVGQLRIRTVNDAITTSKERLRIDHSTGDISFYEDTGTTAKFFWDASEERLGLGTSSPSVPFHTSTAALAVARFESTGTSGSYAQWRDADTTSGQYAWIGSDGDLFKFYSNNNTLNMTMTTAGNVGIGTSSPASLLHANNTSGDATIRITSSDTGYAQIFLGDQTSGSQGRLEYYNNNNSMGFYTAGSERMRITSSGSVGIGTSSPSATLDVSGAIRSTDRISGDGTEAAPAFRFTTDTNTGMFPPSGGDAIGFSTGGAEAMRIDSSGNVGIGTSSPAFSSGSGLRIERDATATLRLQDTGAHGFEIRATADAAEFFSANSKPFTFDTAGSERMRLDASGNLLVGKTALNTNTAGLQLESDGYLSACRDGGNVVLVNRKGVSDGALVTFQKDGTTVGSIGVVDTDIPYFTAAEGTSGLKFDGDNSRIAPCNASGAILDNTIDLGTSGGRFDDIYATNALIQTSDQNEKQDIAELSDAEQRVAVAAKGLLRKFRWRDAVEEKGDEARTHFGIIAQDLQAAFAAEGLDAGDYAMFIHTTWTDEETGEERSRMGVRYSELLAFIIAAI